MSAPFVLFINPWIFDFAAYDLWVKPLGLLYIAAVLKNNGIGVHFLDCLDVNHPDMTEHTKLKKPARKETGQGHFFQEEVPKPEALQQIKKRYKRYGITPAIFDKELSNFPRPQAVFVTSMMTYWYPGV